MADPKRHLHFNSTFWAFFFSFLASYSIFSSAERTLDVANTSSLQLSPSILVEHSPGSRPGVSVLCERVHIDGLSRTKNLRKIAHSTRVKVAPLSDAHRPIKFEVCFHRNMSLGACMCAQNKWEKVSKGPWSQSMSPFDHKLLDIRVADSTIETFEVSISEEFFLYRVVLLALGFVLITVASSLSKSLVFYYSSAMAVGIILVVLMVLFQGMKLLPTGRGSSLAIFLYSSMIGLGSFLLRYLPGLLHSIFDGLGISDDMYNPLAIFLLAFLVLIGAWLGFWVVRKLILTEDGSVDLGTANFVAWSIRILAAIMILQCSLDPILAAEALITSIAASSLLKRTGESRFLHCVYRKLVISPRDKQKRSQKIQSPISPSIRNHRDRFRKSNLGSSPPLGYSMSPSQRSDSGSYYSTFHTTPGRRKFSDDEWKKFTKEYTKNSLEDLVSSPDFSKWAVAHAERITLTPLNSNVDSGITDRLRRWFRWS